ncbi:MAG: 3-dehydroquinate synthase [Alphaproteobacteria bacterium]|nr:3-dehydroquinate synthase [Alphaproteobacteria bacterium]
MDTNIVTIDLVGREYDIYIGSGLLYRFADFVPEELEGRNVYIVTDTNVETYAERVRKIIKDSGAARCELIALRAGEQAKSFTNVEKISDWLVDKGISRDSIIVAVGGGVVGDVTGFCASTILRGVSYIQVPTTLLAQVDSSVGGKTGINTRKGKNLVGSFYQPAAVIADIETLQTLSKRELLAGYAEVLKYGLIRDAAFFNWLEENGEDLCDLNEVAVAHAVEVSAKAKAEVVQADEKEQGQRAILNFGHTFAHALEAAANYDGRLLHGEAVAIGMVMAFDLSVRMGLCEREDMERVERHLNKIGLPTRASYIQPALTTSVDKLMEIMGRDKKVEKGKMRFILTNGIGDSYMEDNVPEKHVRAVLEDSLGGKDGRSASGSVAKSFGNSKVRGLWRSVFSSHSSQ